MSVSKTTHKNWNAKPLNYVPCPGTGSSVPKARMGRCPQCAKLLHLRPSHYSDGAIPSHKERDA